MSECERCDGDGLIDGEIEIVECPNCRDVCQWCNSEYDDGEPLGESGLSVCRDCIRDMAAYKEDVGWQFHVSAGVSSYIDDGDAFRSDIDDAVQRVFREHGVEATTSDGWSVRNTGEEASTDE